MARLTVVLVGMVLLGGPAFARGASFDGIWRFQERFCIKNGSEPRRCGRGSEQFMFSAGLAYYGGSSGDNWREVGTVATRGRRLVMTVTREGLASLIRGIDAEDVLGGFSFAYAGGLRGRRITDGRMHATVDLALPGGTHPIRGRGTFTGKRVGEVCCLTPPDYDESLSSALGGVRYAPPTTGTGALAGMAAALAAGGLEP